MRTFRVVSLLWLVLSAFALSAAVGCKRKIPEPEPAPQPPAAPVATADPAPSKQTPQPLAPKEGWREVKQDNDLPLCVFSSASEREKYKTVAEVKRQILQADRPLVFGVFAPRCINAACEELGSLQCSVERSGNVLRLKTHYDGLHKDGASCRDGCREATAGCESPVMEPGAYTVEYGGTEIALKLPSSQSMPCFKRTM
jgi:hypothetical protein